MPFAQLQFDNQFSLRLPADSIINNYPRQVQNAAFSWVTPTVTPAPQLIAVSSHVADLFAFSSAQIASAKFAQVFTGNRLIEGMKPYAMCYGGHQFGHWAGQLGDGRAINLAEVTTAQGHKTLQLKGAGLTPYSRTADGLAVLRSSIREFLCSEAMFHLGVPTTRALSLCLTGQQVARDMFYNGNVQYEQGAVVCRVSSSFMRFGSFQLPAYRKDLSLLKQLVDYSIERDFSELLNDAAETENKCSKATYLQWFSEICQRTCKLMVHWQRVGFVHGVMNTDNMSIIGETIDYGPYGWIDVFDLDWTPNTTDAQYKRYRFGAQAEISHWNLFQLANAIYPLIDDADALNTILADYNQLYQQQWLQMMASKIGIEKCDYKTDAPLLVALEELLGAVQTDMTLFYRQLAKFSQTQLLADIEQNVQFFADCFYQPKQLTQSYARQLTVWLTQYQQRLMQQNLSDAERATAMNTVNPKYVLRNYMAQLAIEAAENGDYSVLHELQTLLLNPYDEQPEFEKYAVKRPVWAEHKAGCSTLSCSS